MRALFCKKVLFLLLIFDWRVGDLYAKHLVDSFGGITAHASCLICLTAEHLDLFDPSNEVLDSSAQTSLVNKQNGFRKRVHWRLVSSFELDNLSLHQESCPRANQRNLVRATDLAAAESDDLNLALASFQAYHPGSFQDYIFTLEFEEDGLAANVYVDPVRKDVILAFRGSTSEQDFWFDLRLWAADFHVSRLARAGQKLIFWAIEGILDKFIFPFDRRLRFWSSKDGVKLSEEVFKQHLKDKLENIYRVYFDPVYVGTKELNPRVRVVKQLGEEVLKLFPKEKGFRHQVAGHSLGGLYAQLLALMTGMKGASFNAPGIGYAFFHCPDFSCRDKKHSTQDVKEEVLPSSYHFINHAISGDLIHLFRRFKHFGIVIEHFAGDLGPLDAHRMNHFVRMFRSKAVKSRKNVQASLN